VRWIPAIGALLSRATHELDHLEGPYPGGPHLDEPDDDLPAPLAIDSAGWLVGDGVERIQTLRAGYRWRTRSQQPGGILWHWTATSHGSGRTLARRIASGSGSSVHLWIDADGSLIQSAPFVRGTGHAGGPSSARLVERDGVVCLDPGGAYSANSYLIGVELVNVGEVRSVGGRWLGWPFGRGPERSPVVPASQVVEGVDATGRRRTYQDFTAAQRTAAERLARACRARYGWATPQPYSWGHCVVDPSRKTDPGPMWLATHLPAILDRVLPGAEK
jgi:N-acetyl-anhydromuramyl-L-alanine amidase AmpD